MTVDESQLLRVLASVRVTARELGEAIGVDQATALHHLRRLGRQGRVSGAVECREYPVTEGARRQLRRTTVFWRVS